MTTSERMEQRSVIAWQDKVFESEVVPFDSPELMDVESPFEMSADEVGLYLK